MSATVFFSWQSDVRAAACRTLIQEALEGAAAQLAQDRTLGVEPVIDRDTQDVPGCPDIGATIFGKIDIAEAFVADVTIVGRTPEQRPTPNPNVLIELGYALKALGAPRIILVQNAAFGGPELLPFDLRQKRVTLYSSPIDASERSAERRTLQNKLSLALRSVLKAPARTSADDVVLLGLDWKKVSITPELHRYELVASITNNSERRLDDWQVEIEVPTPLVEPGITYMVKVPEQSDVRRSLFRAGSESMKKPLHIGQTHVLRIGYRVDKALYYDVSRRDALFSERATARAVVDGRLAAVEERPIQELQCF